MQNLKKKHKRLEAELSSHEPTVKAVQEVGAKLMAESNLGTAEIDTRCRALGQSWDELKVRIAMERALTGESFFSVRTARMTSGIEKKYGRGPCC